MSDTGADADPVPEAVLQQAAAWMARLWSGEASEREHAECARWRAGARGFSLQPAVAR